MHTLRDSALCKFIAFFHSDAMIRKLQMFAGVFAHDAFEDVHVCLLVDVSVVQVLLQESVVQLVHQLHILNAHVEGLLVEDRVNVPLRYKLSFRVHCEVVKRL